MVKSGDGNEHTATAGIIIMLVVQDSLQFITICLSTCAHVDRQIV